MPKEYNDDDKFYDLDDELFAEYPEEEWVTPEEAQQALRDAGVYDKGGWLA